MRTVTFEEMKAIGLEILADVADFCEKNGLDCFLYYGTLLGAVRHKGFIPWDDDIDIVLPRPDYERFIRSYESKKYTLFTFRNDANYHLPFAKVADLRTRKTENVDFGRDVRGIEIDVFPMDGLSSDFAVAQRLTDRAYRLIQMRGLAAYRDFGSANIVNALAKIPLRAYAKLRGMKYWLEKLDSTVRTYDWNTSEYVGIVYTRDYRGRQIMKKEMFVGRTTMLFAGHEFRVPLHYHEILSHIYGNYMELPPEEKRVTHHDFTAVWKE